MFDNRTYRVATPSAHGFLNEVYVCDLDVRSVEAAIDEVVAEHRAARRPVRWCVGHWTAPSDLAARLVARGFVPHRVRAMACLTDAAVHAARGVASFDLELAQVEPWAAADSAGWGAGAAPDPAHLRALTAALAAKPRTAYFFGARMDGETVGTAGLFLRGDHGYLVGGQVLAGARGRGVYRTLVAARLGFLRAQGIELAVTHAHAGTSAPLLEHLGFESLYDYESFKLTP